MLTWKVSHSMAFGSILVRRGHHKCRLRASFHAAFPHTLNFSIRSPRFVLSHREVAFEAPVKTQVSGSTHKPLFAPPPPLGYILTFLFGDWTENETRGKWACSFLCLTLFMKPPILWLRDGWGLRQGNSGGIWNMTNRSASPLPVWNLIFPSQTWLMAVEKDSLGNEDQ